MTLRSAFQEAIENLSALMALLPGGVWDADEIFRDGINARNVPREDDGLTIKPLAVIRWGTGGPTGPRPLKAEQDTVEVYLYQHQQYTVIEAALERLIAALHQTTLTDDTRSLAVVEYVYKSKELPADELGGASCRFVRFQIVSTR